MFTFSRYIKPMIAIAAIFVIAAAFVYSGMNDVSLSNIDLSATPIYQVEQGPLLISVDESGTIRPRDQVVLRNETEDTTSILYIVEEGKKVIKGELLVELDATAKEMELKTKELDVQNDKAEFISARENLEIAKSQAASDIDQAKLLLVFSEQDLHKYKEGEYPKLLNDAEADIVIAEDELNQAEEDLKWSKILFEEKYLSQTRLQQDELRAKKAKLNLERAQESMTLLKDFTHQRQMDQLTSDVKQAKMSLERTKLRASARIIDASGRYFWRQERYEDEVIEMNELEDEIKRAKIFAPFDGLALYASSVLDNWDENEDRIRVGAQVDERREIILLTTAETYNIDIQIQETDLNKVKPDCPVKITVDAIPGEVFDGIVKTVSPLPDQQQRYLNPNLKVYNTEIEIHGDSSFLRNGMSCHCEILVKEYDDVIFVPIQAVMKVNDESVVYVLQNNSIEMRPVKVGLDNNRMIHIKEGLSDGDRVLLKPPFDSSAPLSPATDEPVAS